jgi:outer membrane protein assembly factor BamB
LKHKFGTFKLILKSKGGYSMFFKKITVFIMLFSIMGGLLNAQKMFRGNPEHTGYSNFLGIDNPGLLWKFRTGAKENRSTPVIHSGNVYVGSNDSCIYSINLFDGNMKWKFKTNGIVASSPAVVHDNVLFYSNDGYFYSLEANTGSLIWKLLIDPEPGKKDVWDMFLSSPTIYDTLAFVGSDNGKIYCINLTLEDTVWTFQTGERVLATPAVDDEAVYVGSFDGFFYKIDKLTGYELWKFDAEPAQWGPNGEIQASAVLVDSLVCIGTRGEYMYVLRKADGKIKWKIRRENSWIVSSAAIDDSVLYFADSDGYKVHAYNVCTGKKIWDFESGANQFGSLAVSDETVFFTTGLAYEGENKGLLYALSKFTGNVKWTFEVDDDIWSSPVLHDSIILFSSDDGYIYAIHNTENTSHIDNLKLSSSDMDFYCAPNPIKTSVKFIYTIPEETYIDLRIFDITGRTIEILYSGIQSPGIHEQNWFSSNQPNGVYVCRLTEGNTIITQKLLKCNYR